MYPAQPMAAPAASRSPTRSLGDCDQGWVRAATPSNATTAQIRPSRRLRCAATPSGPRNSTATAVPSGSRLTAPKNARVISAVVAPSAAAAARSRRASLAIGGRTRSSSSTAAQHSRSQVVPARPSKPNRCVDAAAPTCTDVIDVSTSVWDWPRRLAGAAVGDRAGRMDAGVMLA